MSPKERVLTAVNHQQPDRTPIQIYATPEIDNQLRDYFLPMSYFDAFEVDFRTVEPKQLKPNRMPEPGSPVEVYDIWGIGYRWVPNNTGGLYKESCDHTFASFTTVEDVENYPYWPHPDNWDYSVLPDQIQQVEEYAVVLGGPSIPDIINGIARGRGMDQVLIDILEEDPAGIAIIDKRVNFYLEYCRRALTAGNGKIDILHIGEDLGTQKASVVSPSTFDAFFRPRHQKFINLAHEYGAKAMLHSCGSTRMLHARFIEMGFDILDSVQPEPANMNP